MSITDNRTIIQKADFALSQLVSDGGLLYPLQAKRFMRLATTEAEAKKVDKKEAEEEEPKRPADNARPVAAKDEATPPEPKRRGRKPKADPAEAGSE